MMWPGVGQIQLRHDKQLVKINTQDPHQKIPKWLKIGCKMKLSLDRVVLRKPPGSANELAILNYPKGATFELTSLDGKQSEVFDLCECPPL